MKPFIQKVFFALVISFLGFMPVTVKALVAFSITPPAISNTYSGALTFQVTGLTAGDTVVVQKYLDINTNGVVDANDLLAQQFQLTDGAASSFTNGSTSITNFNVPGDTDGSANTTITASLYPSLDFAQVIVGKYLFVLTSPSGHFTPITNSFSVTNFPFGQSINGNVVSNTTTPLSNAVVILFQPSGGGQNPRYGTVVNSAGAYSISAPPGTYELVAFRSNYMANIFASPIVTLSSLNVTTNVPLTNATQTISGRIVDTNNLSLGIGGLLIPIQSTNSQFLSLGFSDTNGNFVAPAITNAWKVQVSSQTVPVRGYIKTGSSAKENTSSGSVSGVVIGLTKATGIFYGTVTDNLGNPLPGLDVSGDDNVSNGGLYQNSTDGYTYTNGNYVVGVISGDSWEVYINSNDQYGIYTNYLFSEAWSQQNGGTNFGNRRAVQQNFTGILATNYITGNVKLYNGSAVAGVGVNADATIGGVAYQSHTDTDNNGNYTLNVANGSWTISINCGGGNDGLDNIIGAGTYTCPNNDNVSINNNGGTANFVVPPANSAQISGNLTDTYGNGIGGVTIYASDGVGDNYTTTTAANTGYFSIFAVINFYTVSVDCGQLTALNYYCASDQSADLSGGPAGVAFTVSPISTPTFLFTNLYAFSASAVAPNTLNTNRDGISPSGGLLLAGNVLFGTAQLGGTNGAGTLFAVSTNISYFTNFHAFSKPATNQFGTFTNSEGGVPVGSLVLTSNILYGTDSAGGTNGNGTVFAINTNGTSFRVIHTFVIGKTNANLNIMTNSDGANPGSAVVLSSNILYSTTFYGGTNGNGIVFALNTNGTFAVLHTFAAIPSGAFPPANGDGANPYGALVLAGATLYGTATSGGTYGYGTIFAVNTNGTGFTNLYSFTGNTDGANPYAGLLLVTNTLYGVAAYGGSSGSGTVFSINTNSSGFSVLHTFTGGGDGGNPQGGMIYSNNILYGTTVNGGSSGFGTVFSLNLNTSFLTALYAFTDGTDGANPYGTLILGGNTLYGTASAGGNNNNGAVFGVAINAMPTPPLISSPVRLSSSQFQILVSGVAGQNCTVLMNTNIATTNWSSIFFTNPSGNAFQFTDPHATNKQRFYRISE